MVPDAHDGDFKRKPAATPDVPRWRARLAKLENRLIGLPWAQIGRSAAMVAVVVLACVVWVYRAPVGDHLTMFIAKATGATVQSVAVEGVVYTGKDELQQALGLQKGDSLVGFDASAARARIEALPWVRLASVDRELPANVKVTVYEYIPLARVVADGAIWVVNQEGDRIVTDADNRFAGLPLLEGEGSATAAGQLFATLSAWPQLISQLREAKFVGDRRWDLRFVSGVTVQLPEATADYGPADALPVLAKLEEARHVLTLSAGEVDLRLPDRVVLRIPDSVADTPVTNQPASRG
ncbi:MAG: FtsQ-type POTRA domain-containing protein [Proteobacteria bacterium]|nr:FtsQ-type POTRA domain-containing protein [Pseudomonadota bacterium]